MTRLADLQPRFLKVVTAQMLRCVDAIGDADGVEFLCPKCLAENGGPSGTHVVICWQPHVPQEVRPSPGRWTLHGTGFDDLTLKGRSDSVQLVGGCASHFFIRNGSIEMC